MARPGFSRIFNLGFTSRPVCAGSGVQNSQPDVEVDATNSEKQFFFIDISIKLKKLRNSWTASEILKCRFHFSNSYLEFRRLPSWLTIFSRPVLNLVELLFRSREANSRLTLGFLSICWTSLWGKGRKSGHFHVSKLRSQVEIYKPREAKYTEFWVDFNEATRYIGDINRQKSG